MTPLQPTATPFVTCFCCLPSFSDLSAILTSAPQTSHPTDNLLSTLLLTAGFTSYLFHFSSTAPWCFCTTAITWLPPYLLLCLLLWLSPLVVQLFKSPSLSASFASPIPILPCPLLPPSLTGCFLSFSLTASPALLRAQFTSCLYHLACLWHAGTSQAVGALTVPYH